MSAACALWRAPRGWRAVACALLVLAARPSVARAEVEVLTMTPGPRLFERFGHTALVVGERVYNFGTFDGDDPHLVARFLRRDLPYWLSVGPREAIFGHYDERRITIQTLALSPAEEAELAARLDDNARPERRAYRYDFFLDNCATRVRDAIDRSTGGALARAGAAPGSSSFRGLVEQVLAGPPLLGAAVSLLLNASTDVPTTRWQEAFLPRELQRLLADAVRADGRPLVRATRVHQGAAYRPAAGSAGWGRAIDRAAGAAAWLPLPIAALVVLVGRRRRGGRALGAALALGGLLGGLLGAVLLVAALMPYPCTRANASLLLLHPLLLALVPGGLALRRAAEGSPWVRLARLVVGLSALVAALDGAAHLVGLAHERHLGLLAAVLAWHLLALAALRPPPASTGTT